MSPIVSWSLNLPPLAQGLLALGAFTTLRWAGHLLSFSYLLKPSRIRRYLHTTDGKAAWALITGASGGIGGQLAHELATLGFNVVLHGRSQGKLDAAKARLARDHPLREFRTLVIDASEFSTEAEPAWLRSIRDINLTVLVNNAGGITEKKLATLDALTPSRLVYDLSVNGIFPTLLMHHLIPHLERNAPGLIVNIGSLADTGLPLVGSYPASKAYNAAMTDGLAREMRLRGRDIEVLGVKVGSVWGTNQTIDETQDFFAPDAGSMARAVLARVGCGRNIVVGHWRHLVLGEALGLLPGWLQESILTNLTTGWNIEGGKIKAS